MPFTPSAAHSARPGPTPRGRRCAPRSTWPSGAAGGRWRRALAELHAAGSRPRRPRPEGPESLTEREAHIAELAGSGMTNGEIAKYLVVTPRTVAFHLGNAYRKLGIAGRSELAAALDSSTD